MTIHAAKGLGVPHRLPGRLGGRRLPVAARARRRRPRQPRGGTPPRLCRHHPRPAPATILHAANRRIYGQWTSSIPSRFVAELPDEHIEEETTMTGGESLWRAQWSERADPFAHVARRPARPAAARGPAGSREPGPFNAQPQRIIEAKASAVRSATRAATTCRSASACSTASSATARSRRSRAKLELLRARRAKVGARFIYLNLSRA